MWNPTLVLVPALLLAAPAFAQETPPVVVVEPSVPPQIAAPEEPTSPVSPPVDRSDIPDFTSLDTNQDAVISVEESALDTVMSEGFVDADENKNLQVSYQEFNAWIRTIRD